ncbi:MULTISPECIES: hypothetical protein [unclassified Microcoleus]|uniref:hypothetical protein n=1 Tax=unclassified Microcoleus TaxID=2642155 RepID=UPI002FD086CA
MSRQTDECLWLSVGREVRSNKQSKKTIILRVPLWRSPESAIDRAAMAPYTLITKDFSHKFSWHSPDNENSGAVVKRVRKTLLSMF